MTTTRRSALGLLAGTAALGLARPSLAAEPDRIALGALRFTSEGPTFIGVERGYFREEGLEVKLEFFQAAQPMAVAIASGDVDFGVTAITAGLVSLATKGAVKVIGGALREEKGVEGQMILASRKAYETGLRTPHDLAGRTYGITTAGSSFHYMAQKIADREGIRRTDIHLKPLQQIGAIIGSLTSGQIDAWSIIPDIGKTLVAGGEVREIGKVGDYIPDYQVTAAFTSQKLVSGKPDLVRRFLRAKGRALDDYNAALVDKSAGPEEQQAVLRILHKYVMADRPFEVASASFLSGAMRISRGSALNVGSVADQLAWFGSEKLIPPDVKLDTLVDGSFVKTG